MEPQIRYARTTDGVRIAYTRVGSGPPVLYCDFGMRFETVLAANFLLQDALSSCARVTYLDPGGCGASDRDVTDMSVAAMVRATEAAVAACMEDERFTLIATVWAGPSAALYATAHPDRVERLIRIGPPAPFVVPAMVHTDWSMGRRLMATTMFPDGPVERQRWWGRAVRDSFSQAAWMAMVEAFAEIDQISIFERVRVPTLFIAGGTREAPRQHATRLAAAVDDARLVLTDGTGPMDDDPAVVLACLEFMGIESPLANKTTRGDTAVILYADIVDSTALTERLGDAAFRSAARTLDDRMRTAIRVADGSAIEGKLVGDGVLAVFTSAANAIDAALACTRACDGTGLQLHLGLHAGDVIREEGNVFGGAVNIASRISGLSAGEVLVSRTVRDLARTSAGVVFEDRGEHALKGIADPVRVFTVRREDR